MTATAIVYSKTISVPSMAFPNIKRRKLAINDIGEGNDGFTRIPFELQDGDIIQVIRQQKYPQKPGNPKPTTMYLISEGECEKIDRIKLANGGLKI